jgi:Uma2 family endonuclease
MSDMAASQAPQVRTRPITVDEYYRMAEAGIFKPHERVELLNGRIVEMPPIGPRHAYAVTALDAALQRLLGGMAAIFCQSDFHLDPFSQPQPDLAVVRGPLERYVDAHPSSESALLLIEVAESTLRYDGGEKLHAYARTGVPEYWIIDLVHGCVELYADPEGDRYRTRRTLYRGEALVPRAFPDVVIPVDDIVPVRARP